MYLTQLDIKKVRHLKNIQVPISDSKKNVIFTGRNGSGKTSLLMALTKDILRMLHSMELLEFEGKLVSAFDAENPDLSSVPRRKDSLPAYRSSTISDLEIVHTEVKPYFSTDEVELYRKYKAGEFILASFGAVRRFDAVRPKHVEKVELKTSYDMKDRPGDEFIKYILDIRVTQALASSSGRNEKAKEIAIWFDKLEELLKDLFDDDSVRLEFNEDTFEFHILENGKESYDLNQLADGYSAIMEIVADLMLRMQRKAGMSFFYELPGIVFIDEIETHLHLSLQKKVMRFLTGLFPEIQFILTTHSPFILNSTENAVIFDLENRTLVNNGLTNVPYEGVVKGYFEVDLLSTTLRKKYNKFIELIEKKTLSEDDLEEISRLEIFLDEIPDYLAFDLTTEYKKRKLEFELREDGQ